MSHNLIKVSSKTPSVSSDITLNLDDVTSVSSPTSGQVLAYDGINWVSENISVVESFEKTLDTTQATSSYNSTYQWEIPNPYLPSGEQYFLQICPYRINAGFYVTLNTTSDITANLSGTTSQWYYKFTVNTAGVYRMYAHVEIGLNSSNDASLTVQWSNADNSVTYGPRVNVHRPNMKQVAVVGVIDASVNDVFGLYMHKITNGPYAPGSFGNTNLVFEKIG